MKGNYRVRIKKRKEENRESYMRHTGESETENGMREKMKERERKRLGDNRRKSGVRERERAFGGIGEEGVKERELAVGGALIGE